MEITTVGLDLAKNVFQVHAISSTGEVVVRRSLRRAQVIPFFTKLPPCWSAWRPAARAITGRASWSASGTRFG
jgi:transposase